MNEPDDAAPPAELAHDFSAGQPHALAAAYARYAAEVHGLARQVASEDGADASWADEVTLASFVRAWTERDDFPAGTAVRDRLQAAVRSELLERRASLQGLRTAMQALPVSTGTVLAGVALQGQSLQELAAQHGLSPATTAAELYQGLMRLRDQWEADHAAL